jgi:hypothetical protein
MTLNNLEATASRVRRYRFATERFSGYCEVGRSSAVPIEKWCDRGPLRDLQSGLCFSPLDARGCMQSQPAIKLTG